MKHVLFFLSFVLVLCGCKKQSSETIPTAVKDGKKVALTYAKGLTIKTTDFGYEVLITQPWPKAKRAYRYALVKHQKPADVKQYDAVLSTPIDKMIATSTTHLAPLVQLDRPEVLIGFPTTDYISHPRLRKQVKEGHTKDVGTNLELNTETVLVSGTDLVMGYGINGEAIGYKALIKAQVPVLFNGEWTEQHPLGRAEWIKFIMAYY
jgi:hypothetical protein